jgi:hypothetical protein
LTAFNFTHPTFEFQALHIAARYGFASTCELLVRSGAALESGAAKNQATPLLLAVEGTVEGVVILCRLFQYFMPKFCSIEVCSIFAFAGGHAGATSVLLQVCSCQ